MFAWLELPTVMELDCPPLDAWPEELTLEEDVMLVVLDTPVLEEGDELLLLRALDEVLLLDSDSPTGVVVELDAGSVHPNATVNPNPIHQETRFALHAMVTPAVCHQNHGQRVGERAAIRQSDRLMHLVAAG